MASVIDTLDKAARHGMVIRAECACGNLRYYRAVDLAMLLGGGRDPRSIKFRCESCKPRVTVTVLELDRDRMPKVMVWRPHGEGKARYRVWMPERLR